MDNTPEYDSGNMGSSPIKPAIITCGVTAAFKTLAHAFLFYLIGIRECKAFDS